MDKEVVVLMYNGISLSHEKEWNNAIWSNMDGSRDYHTKWSKSKTNITWYHLYVESKKMIQKNLFTKQKQTHRLQKQTYGYGEPWGGRDKLGVWDEYMHTTIYNR